MEHDIIPSDTRYVPIPQQPYCCGPASLTMVMIRNGIRPLPQELIGYHLGLVVPTERRGDFWNPRHAQQPVVASGFGTQIQNEKEFGMNKMLRELVIPLVFRFVGADLMGSKEAFVSHIKKTIEEDGDVLVCLNWGSLTDQADKNWGHILCVDQIYEESIRFIDTDVGAKWKTFSIDKAFNATRVHGTKNYGGLWVFNRAP